MIVYRIRTGDVEGPHGYGDIYYEICHSLDGYYL